MRDGSLGGLGGFGGMFRLKNVSKLMGLGLIKRVLTCFWTIKDD